MLRCPEAEDLSEVTWRLPRCEEGSEQLSLGCVPLFFCASSVVILDRQHDWQELTGLGSRYRLQLCHGPGIIAASQADIWETSGSSMV